MTPTLEDIDGFRASLRRCLADESFLRDFYDRFMASSEEIREKFRDTDFARQIRVLADSLYVMAVAAEGGPDNVAWSEVGRLSDKHRALGVRSAHLDTWLESLMATVRDRDPEFSADVEAAWRRILAPGIEHMRARLDR